MLAEKVETREEFFAARKAGFVYFQGFFFSRPETLTTHEIPANRLNYIRIPRAVSRDQLDPHEIENLVKIETSVCYRLLRYPNSAAFGFDTEIHSVRHALSLLGERETRRWVRLVATLGSAPQKSTELVSMALARARFCELVAPQIKRGDSDLFLLGLLSLIDAMLEVPMVSSWRKFPSTRKQSRCYWAAPVDCALFTNPAGKRIRELAIGVPHCTPGLTKSEVSTANWMPCSGPGRSAKDSRLGTPGPSGGKLRSLCPCAGA